MFCSLKKTLHICENKKANKMNLVSCKMMKAIQDHSCGLPIANI